MTMKEEVAVMKNDVEHIKEHLTVVSDKINKMYETFVKGEGKISVLNKEVFGNGKPGLRSELTDVKIKLAKYVGIGTAIIFIGQIIIQVIF